MGLLPRDFWSMTYNEFCYYAEGYNERQEFDLYNSRLIMWAVMQPHMKKGKRLKPEDLMTLSFDKNKSKELAQDQSVEDYKIKKEQIERFFKGKKM